MKKTIKILAIAGSLRQPSWNKGLLRAAIDVAPDNCSIEIFDLKEIPLYNSEIETPLPDSVNHFKSKITSSDAILFATPEYNYSFSGVLKNAIDWGSRPYNNNSWNNKPCALMGASPSLQGTSRAQYHLRQVLFCLNMHTLNKPELMVGLATDKFDTKGNLIDLKTKEKIKELILALMDAVIVK